MMIDNSVIAQENEAALTVLSRDYATLGEQLDRRGIAIDDIKAKVSGYGVAIPSWGLEQEGRDLRVFPAEVSPGTYSTSLRIARLFIN